MTDRLLSGTWAVRLHGIGRAVSHRAGVLAAQCLVLAALSGPDSVLAQDEVPLFLVGPGTEIAKVEFRFLEARTLEIGPLKRQLALQGPGPLFQLRSILGALPLVPSPQRALFDPPSLLRDVVRLERYYQDQGFPDAQVSYEVVLDSANNSVNVAYVIREGGPLVLDTLIVRGPDGSGLAGALHEELRAAWSDFERELSREGGRRLDASLRARLQNRVTGWLRDRGYPYPTSTPSLEGLVEGAVGTGVRMVLDVAPGTRMRVGEVRVEGNRRLAEPVLRREVPLREGDWFSRARLADGQAELFGLDMVRIAVTSTERSAQDDRVDVRLRITEGSLHLLSSRLGWGAGSGVSADVSWSHRDFLGGARTLDLSSLARTGFLAPEATVARRYGVSVSLRQPWLFDRRVEGIVRPFVEYRDDLRDESVQFGTDFSALFRRGPRRNITLRYSLTSRRVIEAGAGVVIGQDGDFLSVLAALDTLDLDRRTSSIGAVARWARAPSDRTDPRIDWDIFASAEVAGPRGLSTVEYGKVVAQVGGSVPLGSGVALRARLGGGRVMPYGLSVPAPDGSDRLEIYFKLRDAVLTAGGSQDVRGWANDLLGPKAPDVRRVNGGAVASARYVPLGGLARWTGSVQVEVPMPFFGRPHGVHAFLDGGRVWTPDGRFLPTDGALLPDQLGSRVRLGTGIGVSFGTPVGPVQLDLGYKLNPSLLDVRDPGAVGQALLDGSPITDVPERPIQRWHLHLSLGGIS